MSSFTGALVESCNCLNSGGLILIDTIDLSTKFHELIDQLKNKTMKKMIEINNPQWTTWANTDNVYPSLALHKTTEKPFFLPIEHSLKKRKTDFYR